MNYPVITLYRKNQLGIGEWSIFSFGDTIHISHSSVLGGEKIFWEEKVLRGKQGRSIEQQVKSRIDSRISKQRDKGYVDTIALAEKGAYNQLGLIPPMLAKTYLDKMDIKSTDIIQPKYNGLRCLITRQDGELIAYSRRGKIFEHVHEIIEEAGKFVSEGQTIDGELYVHGASLQLIGSLVKCRQELTSRVKYLIYDLVSKDSVTDRIDGLSDMIPKNSERCLLVPNWEFESVDIMNKRFCNLRKQGYEGLMIRRNGFVYESNVRSSSLLKVKAKFDAEVILTDVQLSEKGYPVGLAKHNGQEFKISLPGGREAAMGIYSEKEKYIGRELTIEFRELTDDGVPFHAVGIRFRGEE